MHTNKHSFFTQILVAVTCCVWHSYLHTDTCSCKMLCIVFCLDLCRDDYVSVYADIDGKCKRGLTVEYRNHTQYVGNGYAQLSRHELFSAAAVTR